MTRLARVLITSLTILLGFASFSPVYAEASPAARGKAQARVTEAKKQSCLSHEASIKQRSESLTNLALNMEEKFDAIALRVEDYYTGKVVPAGKTVTTYNMLIADIATKKAAVQTALTAAQNDANTFSCTVDNPKAQLTQYRRDMQTVKGALKDYRTSIKNLIVAVRGQSKGLDSTPSATPKDKE